MKILDVPRSGSYAGLTSSRNRYGQYVRTRAIPVNPGTTFQAAVRARLSAAADDWKGLTAGQRAGWADLGNQMVRSDSMGSSYSLTGFQAYVSLRSNLAAAGDAALTDAPLYAPPDPMLTLTPTISSVAFSVAYTPTPVGAGERVFLSASPQRSAGRAFEGDTRLIQVTAAAGASPTVILTSYTARFGAPVTGQRIFVVAQRYKSGYLSAALITSVVVA
jgi:hypothetical protein